jgi:hypothetical protein
MDTQFMHEPDKIYWFKTLNANAWNITLKGFEYGKLELFTEGDRYALIDTGSPILLVPSEDFKRL